MTNKSMDKILFFGCASLAVICQISAFANIGQWGWMIAAAGLAALWWVSKHYAKYQIGSATLVATVGLAVIGVALKSSGWMMISSASLGLAAWDFLLLEETKKDNSNDHAYSEYLNNHLKTCAGAVGTGMVIALTGRLINIQIPFFVMLGLVALIVFASGRIWRYFIKPTSKPYQTASLSKDFQNFNRDD